MVSAVVVLVCAWITAAAGAVAAMDASRIVTAEAQWIAKGGYTLVVTPSRLDEESVTLDAARCDRLSTITGVAGSFAVSATGSTLAPTSAPGAATTLFAVTPGIYDFFGMPPPQESTEIIAPARAAERPGLVDGEQTWLVSSIADDWSDTSRFPARIRLLDSPILGEDISGSYLAPEGALTEATACYVATDAAHLAAVIDLLPGALASPTSPAVAEPRVPTGSYGVLGFSAAYDQRVSRWAWAGAAAVLLLLWALLQRLRRQRLAVYATFGAGPRSRLVMQVSEWSTLSLPGCALGTFLAITGSVAAGADPATVVLQAPVHALAGWLAATTGVIALGLWPIGTLLDNLKDRT
ncbi:hypothetical protein ICW40_18135 [Actinotalea ferrariae]|nr:hypothetical protein [Actinotalea ferrariae]